ncbi:unnamed protein product, partial [Thlaspi arvense]
MLDCSGGLAELNISTTCQIGLYGQSMFSPDPRNATFNLAKLSPPTYGGSNVVTWESLVVGLIETMEVTIIPASGPYLNKLRNTSTQDNLKEALKDGFEVNLNQECSIMESDGACGYNQSSDLSTRAKAGVETWIGISHDLQIKLVEYGKRKQINDTRTVHPEFTKMALGRDLSPSTAFTRSQIHITTQAIKSNYRKQIKDHGTKKDLAGSGNACGGSNDDSSILRMKTMTSLTRFADNGSNKATRPKRKRLA